MPDTSPAFPWVVTGCLLLIFSSPDCRSAGPEAGVLITPSSHAEQCFSFINGHRDAEAAGTFRLHFSCLQFPPWTETFQSYHSRVRNWWTVTPRFFFPSIASVKGAILSLERWYKKKKKNHLIKGSRGVLSTVRRSALEKSVEINNAFKTCFETYTKD